MVRKILIGLLVVLVLIQFIRPKRNLGNAQTTNDITYVTKVPDSIQHMLQAACYDCHSNRTNYPWYAEVNLVGLWLANHINEGKRELNFSEFATYNIKRQAKKFEEIAETVQEHEMPMDSYLWIHDEARLTDVQRTMLIDWAKAEKARATTKL
jgi:hypothetical protein